MKTATEFAVAPNTRTWMRALDRAVVPFSARRPVWQAEQAGLIQPGIGVIDQLDAARRAVEALERQVADLNEQLGYFDAEEKAARTRAETAEALLQLVHARVPLLSGMGTTQEDAAPSPCVQPPRDLQGLAGWCDQSLAGRLVLAPSARRGLRSSRFGDAALVGRCLNWLAHDYRDRRRAGGEGSLRDVVVERGIRNAPCGSNAHDIEWEGRAHQVAWHIKSGGNTRDPARCLRIYYFWSEPAQQVVVTHLPEHRATGAS